MAKPRSVYIYCGTCLRAVPLFFSRYKFTWTVNKKTDILIFYMENVSCDYIIAGAGAAGLASAQYAARSGLQTIVLELSESGGQALQIMQLENYPGQYPPVSGGEFISAMRKQAESFGAKIVQAAILSIDKIGLLFYVHTQQCDYTAPALLISTGAEHRMLGVPGEKEFTGAGVSYCAVCDGPFFRDKNIIVVGGGDSACAEALYLATLSGNVTLLHRRAQLRAGKNTAERIQDNKNITVRYNTIVKEILGKERVESVIIEDAETGIRNEQPADAVFIFIGMNPRTELVDMLPKDSMGCIKTNEKMETIIPGLFCAGDVRAKSFRQIITAVSDGAIAAHEADMYVRSLSGAGVTK
jgi:thioredoxin reductase (NADPH)